MVKGILHDLVEHCALCAVDDRLVGAVLRDDGLRTPGQEWVRAPQPGCARSPRPPLHRVSAPCRTRSHWVRADRARTGCAWMYCECVRSRHRSVRGYSPESGSWFGFPFLSTSLPDFPASGNGICSLFAVILCTFTRVPETGSQTKKNPRGLHFRRGSSRERRFELEI